MDKVQLLCDAINEKRGKQLNDIGSLFHLKDMATNAVAQVGNKDGGYYIIATGEDKGLINYLTKTFC